MTTVEMETLTARQAALRRYRELEASAQEWDERGAAARVEASRLEEGAGVLALDDPAAAAGLPGRIADLRTSAELAEKAAGEARARLGQARREALLAEAAELDEPIAEARAAVAAHEAKTARLLKALQDHTNQLFIARSLGDAIARSALDRGETVRLPAPKRQGLAAAVSRLELVQRMLQAAAQGADVRTEVPEAYDADPWTGARRVGYEDLTESLRQDGIAPAPGFAVHARAS